LLSCIAANAAESPTNELCVATYNIRYASPTGANAWPERRPLVCDVIRAMNPDVMGTQEGLLPQLNDIAEALPQYHWIGAGRDGGMNGEFMAVFYRTNRLQPLSTNHYWLSDTPEVPASTSWGNRTRRMVTSVAFRDRQTGITFDFVNTHFDHEVPVARVRSAQLIRERLGKVNSPFVLLVGDFNTNAESNPVYDALTGEGFLKDTWTEAAKRIGEGIATFNGFQAIRTNGARIDWILTRGNVRVDSTEIVTTRPDGKWPSDHFPVVSRMVLMPSPAKAE